jgi:hypothetical protein
VKRFAILALTAACTSPAASSLKPSVQAQTNDGQLFATVDFDSRDVDVSVEATFRGKKKAATHDGDFYSVRFDLDHPLEADEPLDLDIDGVSMTMTAPPDFGDVQEPLFISRGAGATISWTTTSADPIVWYVLSSACAQSMGAELPANAAGITFSAADWQPPPDPLANPGATCSTDVRIIRHRDTAADPAFAGGGTTFEQIFDAQFALMP